MKGTLAIAIIFLLCLSIVFVFASKVMAQQSSVDWPMFRADLGRDGVGTSNSAITRTLLWNYTTGDQVRSSPAVVNGVVYIGSEDGNVYALNAANGAQIWNYTTSNMVFSCPAVVGSVVYVGSSEGIFYALDAADGIQLWNYTTTSPVDSSPAVASGVVYVGSDDDNVYALGGSNSPSPTPTSSLPSPTSSQNPTASPSPTVPEYPSQTIGIMLVISIITVLPAATIAKKRRNWKTQTGQPS